MATTAKFEINGVVDTARPVLENINTLATASGVFVTWDPSQGTWSVIKNDVGNSVMSFDDSNIVGNINVSGSGINELYNSVTIEFPHQDLNDTRDYIDLEIPAEQRFPQELDNKLEIKLNCINNPVQAQLIASRELKQSRVDKRIEFVTSYVGNGLSAGDLIDITSTVYGYNKKVFRVITITEEDTDESGILFSIQALEYDAAVYSTDGLVRKERSKKTGVTPKAANEVILAQDGAASAADLGNLIALLGPAALLSLLNSSGGGNAGVPYVYTFQFDTSVGDVQTLYNAFAGAPGGALEPFNGNQTLQLSYNIPITQPINLLTLFLLTPSSSFSYWTVIDGASELRNGFFAYAPSIIDVFFNNQYLSTFTADWQSNTITIPLRQLPPGTLTVNIRPLLTYDMDQEIDFRIYPFNHAIQPNSSGAGISLLGLAYQL